MPLDTVNVLNSLGSRSIKGQPNSNSHIRHSHLSADTAWSQTWRLTESSLYITTVYFLFERRGRLAKIVCKTEKGALG